MKSLLLAALLFAFNAQASSDMYITAEGGSAVIGGSGLSQSPYFGLGMGVVAGQGSNSWYGYEASYVGMLTPSVTLNGITAIYAESSLNLAVRYSYLFQNSDFAVDGTLGYAFNMASISYTAAPGALGIAPVGAAGNARSMTYSASIKYQLTDQWAAYVKYQNLGYFVFDSTKGGINQVDMVSAGLLCEF
jgi:hypothetical protein